MVCYDKTTNTVVKSPHDVENKPALEIERIIYEKIKANGGHRSILYYHEPYEAGIRLEYATNGTVRGFLDKSQEDISENQRLQWAENIAEAVAFIQSHNIIHGDLSCGNILLNQDLQAKLSDFGGSSLDGSELLVAASPSHLYPGESMCLKADVFALGSTIYELMTGHAPYHMLPEEEIERAYERGEFPSTKMLGPIGRVIMSCWADPDYGSNAAGQDIIGICLQC